MSRLTGSHSPTAGSFKPNQEINGERIQLFLETCDRQKTMIGSFYFTSNSYSLYEFFGLTYKVGKLFFHTHGAFYIVAQSYSPYELRDNSTNSLRTPLERPYRTRK